MTNLETIVLTACPQCGAPAQAITGMNCDGGPGYVYVAAEASVAAELERVRLLGLGLAEDVRELREALRDLLLRHEDDERTLPDQRASQERAKRALAETA